MPKEGGEGMVLDHPFSSSSATKKPPRSAPIPKEETVVISSSPIKDDPNKWLPHFNLYQQDKAILESSEWLNDGIISAAQNMLQAQTRGKLFGWQSTQFSKREGLFSVVPPSSPFVQVLHTGNCHWVTTSNVNVHGGGCYKDTIGVYDSGRPITVHSDVIKSICYFFKCKGDVLRLDILNVIPQPNANDCGVHALAYATELAYGEDPVTCNWDMKEMRRHLLQCMESGVMTRFPKIGQRRIRFGTRV
jgi:hypothetical protein